MARIRHSDEPLAPHTPTDLLLLSQTIADPARTAAPVLDELETALSSLHDEPDHWRILALSAAAMFPDRLAAARGLCCGWPATAGPAVVSHP